ncbi:MAG: GGDEF domain-containing protein [Lacrimispora sp.]|uniref:GGDEF domain-containing protein n=1 Tax=Lacrimispora sp. TaxID=2719234 RepID=UPI0039E28782
MEKYKPLIDKMKVFEKTYDIMRIVDPMEKIVIESEEDKLTMSDATCFDFWERGQMCQNCISMRAYNEDDIFYKMDYKENQIFMITAVPVWLEGKRLIIELIKDASSNMILGEKNSDGEVNNLSMIEFMGQAAVRDSLTGLYNRRYIDERLPVDLRNAALKNEPLSVVFADIDFFKAVNDTYGHPAGDVVLKEFSREMEKFVRKDRDWVARFGGEEFFICLPKADLETARKVAERMRAEIEKREFLIEGSAIKMTCSFGVYAVCGDDGCLTAEGVIRLVDRNLYQAKSLGRNRVE